MRERYYVFCAGLVLLLGWVALAGRDVSWDLINHHAYLPFSLFSGRFQYDLFGSGTQAYQNPLGYVPLYGLLTLPVPSWVVGVVMTGMHALVLFPLHKLATQIWGEHPKAQSYRILAISLAGATPIFLYLVGTSSIDPIASALILFSLAILISADASKRMRLLAGGALGFAVAIKPTNGVFAVLLVLLSVWRISLKQLSWRNFLPFFFGFAGSAAVFWGPWAWWLWSRFGNPVFPLFNQIFKSPYAPEQALVATRFMPETWADWIWRPFDMAQFVGGTNVEGLVPDIRPAALVILLLVLCMTGLARGAVGRMPHFHPLECLRRTDFQLLAFTLTSYVLVMATSGNSRYGIAGLMLVGLLAVRCVDILAKPTIARMLLGALLLVNCLYYGVGGDRRLNAENWSDDSYLPFEVPAPLKDQAALHLSIGTQTAAALALEFHPEGRMVNLVGQMSMPNSGPLANDLKSLMTEWQGKTRLLFASAHLLSGDNDEVVEGRARLDHLISRFGIRVNYKDCQVIRLKRMLDHNVVYRSWASCAVIAAPRPSSTVFEETARRAFERIQAQCPKVFSPVPLAMDSDGESAQVMYLNSEVVVTILRGNGVSLSHHRSMNREWLGSPEDVAEGLGRDACEAWRRLERQQRGLRP